jgi:Xaa-Pro dipeptidase
MTPPAAADVGTSAPVTGSEVDFARLRTERRRACLEAMGARHLDALVLGKEANARYVSDARRQWTSGVRPFGPGCIVIGESGAVHLLSTWDDGIPPDIEREHLFAITWNGATMMATLSAVPCRAWPEPVGSAWMG